MLRARLILCLAVDSQELTNYQSSASGSTPNNRNLAINFSFRFLLHPFNRRKALPLNVLRHHVQI
jgi:hypothetical protein